MKISTLSLAALLVSASIASAQTPIDYGSPEPQSLVMVPVPTPRPNMAGDITYLAPSSLPDKIKVSFSQATCSGPTAKTKNGGTFCLPVLEVVSQK